MQLAQEFIDLISTQRTFQANTRVITASDTLLGDLVNIIRKCPGGYPRAAVTNSAPRPRRGAKS